MVDDLRLVMMLCGAANKITHILNEQKPFHYSRTFPQVYAFSAQHGNSAHFPKQQL